MMTTLTKIMLASLLSGATTAFSPMTPMKAATTARSSSTTTLSATPEQAIGYFELIQKATVDEIAATIPDLAIKPDLSWPSTTIAGVEASLDGRDAPGPANIAWVSSLTVSSKLSSLTIFNGPLTDVPHLLSRAYVKEDGNLYFDLDFRPRAYGAYELRDAEGNYPGPDTLGRKAFEYSGNRKEFDTKFGNEEVVAFMESTVASLEGATPTPPSSSQLDSLTSGPLKISISMPLTDTNVQIVANARKQAASYWLSWAKPGGGHEHRPGAPVNSQYVYDTKFRQNCYGALLPVYKELFGDEDGATVTAADSGPLDEAYVGGGS
mmetsp:Transcript_23061/g.33875  ORF Transcript_23061/g.33875 Transcript_23061/m.33875 type:complete len:322 (+) Transcript_23061:162-1127(+)